MELIFPSHKSGKGIYSKAKKAVPSQIVAVAQEMTDWLDERNGTFIGSFSRAYAISHSQVADEPWNMFVVAKEMTEAPEKGDRKHTSKNFYFPARVILNPEILEAEPTIKRLVPLRKLTTSGEMSLVSQEEDIDNMITVPEGCMSFPYRATRNMKRYFRIKVRYQYLTKVLGLTVTRSKTEWVEGLKSHMFQHEVEHACGKNIHFK